MNRHLRLFFFLAFFLFSSLSMMAQTDSRYREAVIGYPGISEKQADAIGDLITNTTGLHLVSYCSRNQCFLVTYSQDAYADATAVANLLQGQFPDYVPVVKTGATHEQLLKNCK